MNFPVIKKRTEKKMEYSREQIKVDLNGKKILIADDNHSLRTLLSDYLKECGCIVSQASNGKEALELSQIHEWDIILTDIKMPVMNGIEFLKLLPPKNKNAVRIMMSGEASIEDVVSGFREEIDDFVIKPFPSMETLRRVAERQLIKVNLQKELNYKNTIMKQYYKILEFLVSNKNPEKLFSFIFHSLKFLIPVNRMELSLFHSDRKKISIKFLLSDRKHLSSPGDTILTKESGFTSLMQDSNPLLIPNLQDFCHNKKYLFFINALKEGMKSCITFPMMVENDIFGFINFFSDQENNLGPQHQAILKGIVPKISVSFERAFYQGQLNEENTFLKTSLQNLTNQLLFQQEALIFSLAELAEKRDKETGYHLIRIQNFVRILSRAYFFKEEIADIGFGKMPTEYIIELLAKTAPLHDIGKVGIPDSILLKPQKLNEKEFEIIKTHTTIGAECLKNAAKHVTHCDFLHTGKDIAHFHHEKWNGTGYPLGLSGDKIPIAARIVSLADTYDALRSIRVYKSPWPHDAVCSYFQEQKGKHFDPTLVDIFFDLETQINQIYTRFSF